MLNKSVTIHLNTPFVRAASGADEFIMLVKGKVTSTDHGGITVDVKSVNGGKEWFVSTQFKEIFIPISKVDFVVLS